MSALSDILDRHLQSVLHPNQKPVSKPEPAPVSSDPQVEAETSLYFQEGTSDKEYHVYIMREDLAGALFGHFSVIAKYGRRGGTLQTTNKTPRGPVNILTAKRIYNNVIAEKKAKGYR